MERIRSIPIQQRNRRNVVAASRKIRIRDVVVQPLKRRRQRRSVNLLRLLRQPRTIAFRNRRGKFGERLQQRARHRIGRNQIGNLLRQIPQRNLWRRVPALQSFFQQLGLLIDVRRQRLHPLQNDFVFGDVVMRRVLQRIRRTLLHALHLIDRHPQAVRHHKSKWERIVPVFQSFVGSFEQLRVQIKIKLFALRQRIALNPLQLRNALRQMLLAHLDARRRIIRPSRILAWISDARRDFGILLHPTTPIGIEISAKFTPLVGGCVGGCVRICGNGEERKEQATKSNCRQGQHAHLDAPSCHRRISFAFAG